MERGTKTYIIRLQKDIRSSFDSYLKNYLKDIEI